MCSFAVNTSCSSTTTQNPSRPGHSDLRARGNQGSHLFSHITCSVTAASRVSKMPCSEVTEAVSPHKRSKSDAANGYEEQMVLKFAKLTENATTPSRGSNRAAGFDLYSAYDYSIGPMDKALVKTDIQIAVPHGYYGRVAPRSGLAVKHFIDVGVKKGDRIAQLICERICYPQLQELQTLDDTERGAGGFGSTGTN
ncbi:Deoxyuridine 5'-triphosphate nucleotidohydrolase, mitochondrial [Labeo rohita]|uniref:Deoxyuridine 5'-triphosphate nucleotidohydrolase n=1 Tax=Labeo rohita TaxID=84645 RepID=A0ABQ8LSF6_LABRO|nr:Deoxyuridine 5'-triphosphate nucleotidohydrolase, mitochondrial [Labeo rohita]